MALYQRDRHTVDDLDELRSALGARVELDPWGDVVVSPATDAHEFAAWALAEQLRATSEAS